MSKKKPTKAEIDKLSRMLWRCAEDARYAEYGTTWQRTRENTASLKRTCRDTARRLLEAGVKLP